MNRRIKITQCIITLATARGNTKTICPSEVARTIWPQDWRDHMQEVREIAFALRDNGEVRIMQKGNTVIGNDVKGPIRIKIK